jgi:FMN reductase
MTVLTITGSPAANSRSHRIAEFVTAKFLGWGVDASKLHLRDLPAEALVRLDHDHPVLRAALAGVASASAIVIATPVYKAAYSGLLKTFLDLLPRNGLSGKAILPIATVGVPAHSLALDYALKPVLSALGARYVLDSIYVLDHQMSWTPEAGPQLAAEIAGRLDRSARHIADSTRPRTTLPSSHSPQGTCFPPHPLDAELARCWD